MAMDFIARALAAAMPNLDAALRARGLAPNNFKTASNIGTRIIGGRQERIVTTTAAATYELLIALATEWDAVRVILSVGNDATSTTPNCYVSAVAVENTLPETANAKVWPNMQNCPLVPPGAGTAKRSYIFSPWFRSPSVPRSDTPGAPPLLCVRAYTAPGTTVMLGKADGTTNFANWATHPSGRIFRLRDQPVDGIGAPTSFTTTTNKSTSPIIGVQYMARGKVYNLFGFGDSITEGQGTYVGEGFGQPAAVLLQQELGFPVEWSNVAWSGSPIPGIRQQCMDVIAAGFRPDLAIMPNASPNSFDVPITDANIDAQRGYRAEALAALDEAGVQCLTWTVLATNSGVKDYNASDSKRRAFNDSWRALANKGVNLADFDLALQGVLDADGQRNLLANTAIDGIHPNDAGNAILARLLANAVKRMIFPPRGWVTTA